MNKIFLFKQQNSKKITDNTGPPFVQESRKAVCLKRMVIDQSVYQMQQENEDA